VNLIHNKSLSISQSKSVSRILFVLYLIGEERVALFKGKYARKQCDLDAIYILILEIFKEKISSYSMPTNLIVKRMTTADIEIAINAVPAAMSWKATLQQRNIITQKLSSLFDFQRKRETSFF
jgi:hypothetical protein